MMSQTRGPRRPGLATEGTEGTEGTEAAEAVFSLALPPTLPPKQINPSKKATELAIPINIHYE